MTFRGKKLSDPSVRDVLFADVTDPDYLYFVDDETEETKRIRISVLKEVVGAGGGGGGTVRQITDADGVDDAGTLLFAVLPGDINGTVQLTSSAVLDPPRVLVVPEGEVGDRLTVQFLVNPFSPVPAAELLVLSSDVAFVFVLDVSAPYEGVPLGSTVEILKTGTMVFGPDTYHIWYVVNGRDDGGGDGGGGIPALDPVPAVNELVASDGGGGLVGSGSTVLAITDAIQAVQDAVDAITSPFPLDPAPAVGTVLITDPDGDPTTTTVYNPYPLITDQVVRGWGRLPAVADTSNAWRGTVGEMRGDVGEFVASVLCDLNAVPASTQDIWGNYELGTTTGGWGITVDATGFGGVISRDSDGALITLTPVANYVSFSAYQAGELLDRTALVTLQVIGTAATLWINGQQAASATLTGGMRRTDVALRPYVGRNNSAGTPRVATSVAVRGVYYFAAAIAGTLYAAWPAAQYSYVRAHSGLLGGRAYGGALNGSPTAADVFHITPVPGSLTQLVAAAGGTAGPLVHATGSSYVEDVLPVVWASLGLQGATADSWAHPPIVATIDSTDSPFTVLPEHAGGIIQVDASLAVELIMPPTLAADRPFRVGIAVIDAGSGATVTSDGVLEFDPYGETEVSLISEGITYFVMLSPTQASATADITALIEALIARSSATSALSTANASNVRALDALHPNVPTVYTSATKTIGAGDAGEIIPFSGASNAVAINVPNTIFATGGTGRAFVFGGVIRDLTNPITLAGTGGLTLYHYGPKSLLNAVGDTFIVKVVSATEAWVYITPRGVPGIDYVEGFIADAGTAANRRGYTRGSDPLSATPSFTAVVVARATNTAFVSGGSRQLFGTRSAAAAAGGGWCIYNEGDVIGMRFTDNGGTQRSSALGQSTTAWRVLHLTVSASGADLTIRLFVDGAQVAEVYDGAAGGQYTAGAEMCIGVLDEGAILPAALHNRIHGAGYATAAMTPTEVGAHADAIIAANKLVQTSSGTALVDGWRADVALGTPAAATWASFLSGTALTTLNTTALTLAAQTAPVRWW